MTYQCAHFEHGGNLGDFWRLWEPGELVGGHSQVGAWGIVDVVAINMDKFVVEVALEWAWPSLRVEQPWLAQGQPHLLGAVHG